MNNQITITCKEYKCGKVFKATVDPTKAVVVVKCPKCKAAILVTK